VIGKQAIAVLVGKFPIYDRELVSHTPDEAGATRIRDPLLLGHASHIEAALGADCSVEAKGQRLGISKGEQGCAGIRGVGKSDLCLFYLGVLG
jgi:hypothetical protein